MVEDLFDEFVDAQAVVENHRGDVDEFCGRY
jgi:hypothetical protein